MQRLNFPVFPAGLPQLEPELLARLNHHHEQLINLVAAQPDGFLPFDQWMHHTLYAPDIGYYSGGSTKFGSQLPIGDFTTAPELTPIFGHTLAQQALQIFDQGVPLQILEFGAGSGALAEAVLGYFAQLGHAVQYQILEISPSLRHRQQQRLASFGDQVSWLEGLPSAFEGVVLANEVLDAMPTHIVRRDAELTLHEVGISLADTQADQRLQSPFQWVMRPLQDTQLAELAEARLPQIPNYQSELNLQAESWVRSLGDWLARGAVLLFDYGFPQHEYYHAQRSEGTLMCHFRHHAHGEALILPGLQDLTAHVDFTAMADGAIEAGLDVLGYTSQARFLLNCGITQLLDQPPSDSSNTTALATWNHTMGAVQKLLSEAEMGELFKVLALGKEVDPPLIGFMQGDRRDRL